MIGVKAVHKAMGGNRTFKKSLGLSGTRASAHSNVSPNLLAPGMKMSLASGLGVGQNMPRISMPKSPTTAASAPGSSSNKGFGVLSMASRAGIGLAAGAGLGLAGAAVSGGNYGQGALAGAFLGAAGGAAMGRRTVRSFAARSQKSTSTVTKAMGISTGVASGFGGGVLLSGSRGKEKQRGFNSNRGNKVSSGAY